MSRIQIFEAVGGGSTGLLTNIGAHYDFQETTGNAADSSGNGRTLTENGTIGTITGKLGNARSYDGNTANFFNSTDAIFSPGSTSISTAAWINPQDLAQSSFPGILGIQATSNTEWGMLWNHSADNYRGLISSDGSAATEINSGTGMGIGTWNLVVMVWDGTDLKVSSDNATFTTSSFTGPVFSGTGDFVVGKRASGGSAWNGYIDELTFWSGRALTQGDVSTLYNSGSGLAFSSW